MKLLKNILFFILFTIYGLLYTPPIYAIYDPASVPNNKVGVHLLDPNEIAEVPELVNNNGGDWGYVTVPIQPSDRDKTKWQTFMHTCADKHLIPVIRITTIPLGGTWDKGRDTDLVDFANFLNLLDWPTANRYIVLFNEVNRDQEWGGTVDPAAYARIVKNAYTIFKERSPDFYMLGPALDDALPNSSTSQSSINFLKAMQKEDPLVWTYFDGWAAHSYPNPGFAASPTKTGWQSIVSYRAAFQLLRIAPKPVFVTETGWNQVIVPSDKITTYWRQAFAIWTQDPQVVAVTPFVLQGGTQFPSLSLKNLDSTLSPSGTAIRDLGKSAGSPNRSVRAPTPSVSSEDLGHVTGGENRTSFLPTSMALRIENFFRSLFGLQRKSYLSIGTETLTVEIADSPKTWEQGLSNRPSLEPGTGMLFSFPRPHVPLFWMKDMQFSIDIIWISGSKVVSIAKNVPVPTGDKLPTYSPTVPVDQVLEVPAGFADNYGIEPGAVVAEFD